MILPPKTSKYLAEAIGTFFLVFAGTGAAVVDGITRGKLGVVGVGLVFGFIVLAMIYSIGHISGAHLNPAVTAGFYAAGRMRRKVALYYMSAQMLGAVAASVCLKLIFFKFQTGLGATVSTVGAAGGFALEFLLTLLLMFVIMGVATDNRAQGPLAGVAIGSTVALAAIFGGPISGASMNPARSFAPALLSGQFAGHWIYWIAPLAGGMCGAWLYGLIRCESDPDRAGPGCC